ncbi:mitochondrial fission protein ELM1 [Mycoplana sp. BE70]|uniref:mitochondrial fission ELM1 family protein n=1 Tax=Mycoplana sp. BE70 TaxID=2817775 RepID=UPI00285F21FF|nr:ELM1/GtrOC1 family putative glycosyltransferase [Mycoplana sp. BE70]MDR6758901.1 mitochondrial fission protein ELM1 [Mycoplana sp. BE70]
MSQCVAVARHFDPSPTEKSFVAGRGFRRIFDPPLFRRSERAPELIISCGFRAEKRALRIKAAYGGTPLTVHLQPPKIDGYDMVFVSRHGWRPEFEGRPGYFQMLGVPHRFSAQFWQERRAAAREIYAPEDEKVAAVFVGGPNDAYDYDAPAHEAIASAVNGLVGQNWKVLISVSRRSTDQTLQALLKLRSKQVVVWDRSSQNPYIEFVAAADAFLIAKDSITMPCEALSTGRPVYVLELTQVPGERLEKFEWYHRDLQETLGLTRSFNGELAPYDYLPPRETDRIAGIIKERLADDG